MNANGILVQGLNDKNNYVKSFPYQGINAYFQFPLTWLQDEVSQKLTKEQLSKQVDDYWSVSQEFISDPDLYGRYIKHCAAMNVPIRALFIESDYADEIWASALPKMEFMGYEYSPIPFDDQVSTDMEWYQPFFKFRNLLNEFGLFRSYEDAERFVKFYNEEFLARRIGDGEMDAYICKVSRICLNP